VSVRLGAGGAERVIRDGLSHVVEYSRKLVHLRQVAEESGGELRGVDREVTRLSKSLGTGSADLIKQAVSLKAAGLGLADVKLSMEAIAKASLAPSFGDSDKATTALISSMAVFDRLGKDAARTLGSINALSNAYAASSEEIIAGLTRGGGAWRAAGGDLDTFAAAMTVVKAKTQKSAATVGTSLKSLSARMLRPGTLNDLSALGVDLTNGPEAGDRAGLFVGPDEALRRTAAAVSTLRPGDTRRSQIVESVAGLHHFSRAESLLSNYGEVERAKAIGRAGESSLDTASLQALESYEVRLNKVREAWLSTARSLGDSPGVLRLEAGLEAGATAASKMVGALAPMLPLVATLGAARLGAAFLPAAAAGAGAALTRGRVIGGVGLAAGVMAPTLAAQYAGPGRETAGAVAGGLQGAALGAAAGSMFGPVGTAVGGVVGALAGFRSALSDAAEGVRSAKMDATLTRLSSVTDSLAKGGAAGDPAEAGKLIRQTRELAAEAARAATGRGDAAGFAAAERAELRKALGPNISAYVNALAAESARAGRRNPGADAGAVADGVAESNRQLLRVVADLSGRTTKDASDDLLRMVKAGQSDAKRAAAVERSGAEDTRVVTAFGGLADAADRAVRGLSTFDARTAALGGGDIARPTAPDLSDMDATGRYLSPLGGAGRPLVDALRAVADLERALPAAVARAAAGNPLDGESFGEKVAAAVRDILGPGAREGETGRGLSLVTRALSARELPALMAATASDAGALARESLAGFSGPTRNATERVGRSSAEVLGRVAELVNAGTTRGSAAGGMEDTLAALRAERARLPYAARNQNPADYMTADALGAPFAASQRRLAGDMASDPEGMGRRLSGLRAEVEQAARQAAIPGHGAAEAAERLGRLKSEAENVRAALGQLADSTKATAGIQERLNALASNRESRLSYAERYVTADPQEMARMDRAKALAIDAGRRGTIEGLPPARVRDVMESLGALGSAKLPELGGERAGDAKRRLLTPLAGIDPADAAEETDLRGQLDAAFGRAEAAQMELVKEQRSLQSQYFQTAADLNRSFLSDLGRELSRVASADAEAKAGQVGRDLGAMRADRPGYDLLERAGVDNDEELGALRARRSDVAALAGSLQSDAKLGADRQASVSALKAGGSTAWDYFDPLPAARARLESLGASMTADQRDAAFTDFGARQAEAARTASRASSGRGLVERQAAIGGALDSALLGSVRGVFDRQIDAEHSTQVGLAAKLSPAGVDWSGLKGAVGTRGGAEILRALDRFGSDNPLGTFGRRLEDTAAEFDRLQAAAARLRAAADRPPTSPAERDAAGDIMGGAALGLATGGPVPRPKGRGTDVVPTVLTPGEFVVSRDAARRHGPLLDRLNRGDDPPQYLAGGGPVEKTPGQLADEYLRAASYRRKVREDDRRAARPDLPAQAQDRPPPRWSPPRDWDRAEGGLERTSAGCSDGLDVP
jgi:hypothetical protein